MISMNFCQRAIWSGVACCAFLLVGAPAGAQPQQHDHVPEQPASEQPKPAASNRGEQYRIQLQRAAGAPQIDGILSDDAWRTATVIDSFTQQEPMNGQPATERTEVKMLYDSGNRSRSRSR